MNKAEIKIVEEQINDCWQVASEIIEEFDMYGGGPEEEENRACEKLEKMQELFGDHNVPADPGRHQCRDRRTSFGRREMSGVWQESLRKADSRKRRCPSDVSV